MKREGWPPYALALAVLIVGLAAVGVPVRTLLFFLAVVACPLMMVFMMGGMSGHGRAGTGQSTSRSGGPAESERRPAGDRRDA
jgi:hypothetical protein